MGYSLRLPGFISCKDIALKVYGHTYSKSMDQPCKVASLARGRLNRGEKYFPVSVRA